MNIRDETLSAYLDGELAGEDLADLERRLPSDADARLRLAEFLAADTRMRAAFALPAQEPAVQERAGHHAHRARHARAENAIQHLPIRHRFAPAVLALAAALGGIAIGMNWQRFIPGDAADPVVMLDSRLVTALETAGSGQTRDGTRIALSFRRKDGVACRQFEAVGAGRHGEGVACHEARRWRLEAWDGTSPTSIYGYHVAGGSALLDAAVDSMDATGAMSAVEESEMIKSGWRNRHLDQGR